MLIRIRIIFMMNIWISVTKNNSVHIMSTSEENMDLLGETIVSLIYWENDFHTMSQIRYFFKFVLNKNQVHNTVPTASKF